MRKNDCQRKSCVDVLRGCRKLRKRGTTKSWGETVMDGKTRSVSAAMLGGIGMRGCGPSKLMVSVFGQVRLYSPQKAFMIKWAVGWARS